MYIASLALVEFYWNERKEGGSHLVIEIQIGHR